MTDLTNHAKAERLRALVRTSVVMGDMTPQAARVLEQIADEWDPPQRTWRRGDHVIFHSGMGDWDLGVVTAEPRPGHRVTVLFDGFVDNHGKRYEPYSAQVDPQYMTPMEDVERIRAVDREQMQAGYEPIYAELT